MLRTTCRLSFRVRASRSKSRTSRVPTTTINLRELTLPARPLERPLHLLDTVGLDNVADLDVVVAGDLNAALEAFADLAHILLEAFEGIQPRRAVHRRIDD